MTVSIGRINIDYYLESAAAGDGAQIGTRDLTAYYTEASAPPGTWWGSGLAGAHLDSGQQVSKWAARQIYEEFADPATGEALGRRPIGKTAAPAEAKTPTGAPAKDTREGVAGFDLTFSVPKSVSVLWALGDAGLQGGLYEAHRQAMAETMEWLEREVIQARAGHAGVAKTAVKGVIASMFDHWDSRAGDPQLHTHVVVANRVQRLSDDAWVTLDSYTLHRLVVAASEKYNSLLYDRIAELTTATAELRTGAAAEADPELLEALRSLGAEEDPRSARAELIGVPDALIAEFSTRSAEIEQRTDELVANWQERNGRKAPVAVVLELRQQATLTTRRPKKSDGELSLPEKMSAWRLQAVNAGFSPAKVLAEATGHHERPLLDADVADELVDRLGAYALADAAQRRTTFNRANLTASTERLLRGVRMSTDRDREQLVERIVGAAAERAVGLSPDRMGAPTEADPYLVHRGHSVFDSPETAVFTTPETVEAEQYLMGRTEQDGPTPDAHLVAEKVAAERTRRGDPLSPDQAAAARAVLSNGRALDAFIGPAGTGKTTTMRAVRRVWESEHGRGSVIGLAPSAVAAAVLGEDIEAPTDNTAKWLYESIGEGAARRIRRVAELEERLAEAQRKRFALNRNARDRASARISHLSALLAAQYAEQAKYRLRPAQLMIVDEASMVGTAALEQLARQAEAAGAKILLVGDPSQLEAVDAGGFLGWMDRNAPVAVLDTVWRFKAEWERTASLALRKGDENVLAEYQKNGRIHGFNAGGAVDAAYQAWLADVEEDQTRSLLIAADNETVDELNRRAQIDLAKAGRVDLETTARLRSGIAGLGDLVLARRNNRALKDVDGHFVKNGARMRITAIADDGTVSAQRTDTGAAIVLPAEYVSEHVELAYAVTAHRSQGVTVDTAHTLTRQGEARELFYVAMTRGRHGNYCYVDIPDADEHARPDEWGIMRPVVAEHEIEILKGVLKNARAERTAHEVEEDEHGWANDLARLLGEHEYVEHAAKATRTEGWIREHAPDRIAAFLHDPGWTALVAADPAITLPDEPIIDDLGPAAIARLCSSERSIASPYRDFQPATREQERLRGVLQGKIDSRLAYLAGQARAEQPDWLQAWEEQAGHVDEVRLRTVLTWRAVSGQEHVRSVLGDPPKSKDRRLHAYHGAAARAVVPVDGWDQAAEPPPPGEPAQDTAALLDQLWEAAPVPPAAEPAPADAPDLWDDLPDHDLGPEL